MSLSCSCESDGDWWYIPAADYSTLATKRSRKCSSCKERIPVGSTVVMLECYRYPNCDVEEAIYGDCGEVPMANRYLCERCADLDFSLQELGFCVNAADDRRELVREYAEMQREARERRKMAA